MISGHDYLLYPTIPSTDELRALGSSNQVLETLPLDDEEED